MVHHRTVAGNSSKGGLYVYAGSIDILRFDKNYIFLVFHISICGARPTKDAPWRQDWFTTASNEA